MSGGDDYITKPFSIEELVLKIEVFLKRSKVTNSDKEATSVYLIGKYEFDYKNMLLSFENKSQRLTVREADLLKYLVLNANKVVKKQEILNEVWQTDSYFNSRSLDVFISKLRKYLKKDPGVQINNIHGIGFILVIDN